MANLIRGLSENGGVVFCGVDSTEIVRKAEKLHTTSATCSAALGRLLTGATLMGSMLKDDRDRITLRVAGGGPAGVLIASKMQSWVRMLCQNGIQLALKLFYGRRRCADTAAERIELFQCQQVIEIGRASCRERVCKQV